MLILLFKLISSVEISWDIALKFLSPTSISTKASVNVVFVSSGFLDDNCVTYIILFAVSILDEKLLWLLIASDKFVAVVSTSVSFLNSTAVLVDIFGSPVNHEKTTATIFVVFPVSSV